MRKCSRWKCFKTIPPHSGPGRKKDYCSNACKQTAYKRRKLFKKAA